MLQIKKPSAYRSFDKYKDMEETSNKDTVKTISFIRNCVWRELIFILFIIYSMILLVPF
jgi:hypothetical protein